MSLDQYNDIVDLNHEFVKYIYRHVKNKQITNDHRVFNEVVISYVGMMVKLINNYFAVISLTDTNFCTEDEAQLVLDALNEIMGTSIVMDFDITTLTYTSNVWDDSLIWSDLTIWSD